MKANINQRIWDWVPVLGFLIILIGWGKLWQLSGLFLVIWITILITRWVVNSKPKKM
jgi:voltage-gated potassium channel Kch